MGRYDRDDAPSASAIPYDDSVTKLIKASKCKACPEGLEPYINQWLGEPISRVFPKLQELLSKFNKYKVMPFEQFLKLYGDSIREADASFDAKGIDRVLGINRYKFARSCATLYHNDATHLSGILQTFLHQQALTGTNII